MDYLLEQPNGLKVNLRDLQLKNLEILKDFDAFCEEHSLKYTLCGGCCIGALRHGGFIPWDDDVDVHMFREDYEKLFSLWKEYGNKSKYNIVKTTKDDFQDTMLTQISMKNTTFIKENQVNQDIDHGIKLEIIPLDGAPENNLKRKIQLFNALKFYLYNRGFAPQNRGKLFNLIGKLLLAFKKTPKSRYKKWKKAEIKMTKYSVKNSNYLTELCVTWKYMKIRYPKDIFIGERRVKFEDGYFPIPYKAEEYLNMAFGDFMKLPIEQERVPKHDAILIDLENSYKKYKGEFYIIEEEKNEG